LLTQVADDGPDERSEYGRSTALRVDDGPDDRPVRAQRVGARRTFPFALGLCYLRAFARGVACRASARACSFVGNVRAEESLVGKVIAIANQKGGVGKTTTAINLGGALAQLGKRVLCLDLDPQANLTVGLGIDLNTVERNIANVLVDPDVSLESIIRPTKTKNLDVAPATLELSAAEVELFNAIGREMALRDKLTPAIAQRYDFIIIDCPPTLGLLTLNALVAASGVIIPVQTQYYSLKGVAALLRIIKTVQGRLNPNMKVLGMLATFYDSRTILGRDMLDALKEIGNHQVFDTVIRQSVKVGEAPTAGVPITEYDRKSDAAKAFVDLAREVVRAH
jgi:chromosome partitioning protein